MARKGEKMPATPISHIGILVHDIDAAKRRFSDILGISFHDNVEFAGVEFQHHDLILPEDGTYAFSVEGPVFIELLQSQPNEGIYGSHQPEGIHHIAMFVPDTASRLEELAQVGVEPEYKITPPGRSLLAAYLGASDLHGCRIEMLNREPDILGYEAQGIVEKALGPSG
jgi:catechol 2,3-dioxygenase-like lactoylglutathione lyase family enzyme